MKKISNKLTLILAVAIIITSVSVMGLALSIAQATDDIAVHETGEPVTATPQVNLEFKVVTDPYELPENGVSAQYAAAAAEELIEKTFGEVFVGRICLDYYASDDGNISTWFGSAETENNVAEFSVDALTGKVICYGFDVASDDKNDWIANFDEKSEETLNREKAESLACEMELRKNQKPYVMTEKDIAFQREERREKALEMLQCVEKYADSPMVQAAIDWTNERSDMLLGGAKAVSAEVLMCYPCIVFEGASKPDADGNVVGVEKNLGNMATLDVTLDNGDHLRLRMKEEGCYVYKVEPLGKLTSLEDWYGVGILDE